MKHHPDKSSAAAFLAAALLLLACGKVELPGSEGDGEDKPAPPAVDTIGVAAFRESASAGTAYWVRGHIVGYTASTSLGTAVFGCPDDGRNTNMLLADDPQETNPARCIPVKLSATGGAESPRAELNLYDHPEFLRRRIALLGMAGAYFRTTGIVTLYEYRWSGTGGTQPANPWPAVDDSLQYVPGGRSNEKSHGSFI